MNLSVYLKVGIFNNFSDGHRNVSVEGKAGLDKSFL